MFRHAALTRPRSGEPLSGDAAFAREIDGRLLVAIIDVLGHGGAANDLAVRITRMLERNERTNVSAVLTALHSQVRGSRGAAIGIAAFDPLRRRLEYVGVGNTVLRRFGETETRLVSQDGVLGQNMRTPRPEQLALAPGDLVLLYTDGVQDRFSSAQYPGVFRHEPEDVVRRIIERFGKRHDDAGCVAVRVGTPERR
jgi:serine phosphatase RsbU (regulator of sigma subunit)